MAARTLQPATEDKYHNKTQFNLLKSQILERLLQPVLNWIMCAIALIDI